MISQNHTVGASTAATQAASQVPKAALQPTNAGTAAIWAPILIIHHDREGKQHAKTQQLIKQIRQISHFYDKERLNITINWKKLCIHPEVCRK